MACAGAVFTALGRQLSSGRQRGGVVVCRQLNRRCASARQSAVFQKLTFVENVMRRIPDAVFGCRNNGDVMIPLYPE